MIEKGWIIVGWENRRELNSDWIKIIKSNKSDIPLDYYLDRIDLDSYWVYKSTRNFIRINKEDIGKYSGYIFFRKDLYYKENIDKWIEEIENIQSMPYLSKPFPRVEILKKIEVV